MCNFRGHLFCCCLTCRSKLGSSHCTRNAAVHACLHLAWQSLHDSMIEPKKKGKPSLWGAGTAGPAAAEGSLEMLECWHLTADGMATLMRDCLLPLAAMHASLGLAQSLQPEGAPALPRKPQQPGQQLHRGKAAHSVALVTHAVWPPTENSSC